MLKTNRLTELTDTELEMANAALTTLAENVNPRWIDALNEVFEPGESELIQRNVGIAMAKRDVRNPVGTAAVSTIALRDKMTIQDGEGFQRAISALKEHNRIVQAGRGRGRAIVLVDSTPLDMPTVAERPVVEKAPKASVRRPRKARDIAAEIDALILQLMDMRTYLLEHKSE